MSFTGRHFRRFTLATVSLVALSLPVLSVGCSSADQGGGALVGGDDTREGGGSPKPVSTATAPSPSPSPSGSTSEDAGSAPASDASTSTPVTTEPAGSCVSPGDKGTASGIGRYCTAISDCADPNQLCTGAPPLMAKPGDSFCTNFCDTDAECADGTTCMTDPQTQQSACLTAACVALAKSMM